MGIVVQMRPQAEPLPGKVGIEERVHPPMGRLLPDESARFRLEGLPGHEGVGALPAGGVLDAHGAAQVAHGGQLHVELAGERMSFHGSLIEQPPGRVKIPK